MHSPGGKGSKKTLTRDFVGPQVNRPAWLSLPGCKLERLHEAVTRCLLHGACSQRCPQPGNVPQPSPQGP